MQTRKNFLGTLLGAAVSVDAVAANSAAPLVRTDGRKPLKVVEKGLGGGKVICLSNRSRERMSSAVFVSPSGRVAVVDGGFYEDGENLRTVLEGLGGKVDFWFLTHAHCDHFGALVSLVERGAVLGRLEIRKLLYSFPSDDWLEKAEPRRFGHVRRFNAAVEKIRGRVPVEAQSKDSVYDLGGDWRFTVLNDFSIGLKSPNINDTSVCLSLDANGRKWLVPGDIGLRVCGTLTDGLGSRLEHEFVFMAHHGQNGGDKRFYAAVKAKTAIWPTTDWLWENDGGQGPGSGPFKTNYTKCWMQELGVKEHYVLSNQDVVFI